MFLPEGTHIGRPAYRRHTARNAGLSLVDCQIWLRFEIGVYRLGCE